MKNSFHHRSADVAASGPMVALRRSMLSAGALAVCLGSALPASAQAPDRRQSPAAGDRTHPQAANRCARYGEGFVPVEGSDACVRIGGRLRIEFGGSPRSSIAPLSGFSYGDPLMGESDGLNRAYIRVPGARPEGETITR
jgi:hypothetical protein